MNIREYQELSFIVCDGETCGIGDLESLNCREAVKQDQDEGRRGMRTDKSTMERPCGHTSTIDEPQTNYKGAERNRERGPERPQASSSNRWLALHELQSIY